MIYHGGQDGCKLSVASTGVDAFRTYIVYSSVQKPQIELSYFTLLLWDEYSK